MKLSQLFSKEQHTDSTRIQVNSTKVAQLNRQIRSLVPGQTISGEIMGRNGGEVQIKLSEDLVLSARVDKNISMEIGQNMTFEVRNNGSTLSLSPLFTNVSADMNVLKALDMAGIVVNETSVAMTEQLMAAGLPVNKNMLQQIMREISSFPGAEISDIIHLHKLQMPVNEANIGQMSSYRNLTHQLMGGMEEVLNALPEVLDELVEKGDMAGASGLYREIFMLVQEGEAGNAVQAGSDLPEGDMVSTGNGVQTTTATLQDGGLLQQNEGILQPTGVAGDGTHVMQSGDSVLGLGNAATQALSDVVSENMQEIMQDGMLHAGQQGSESLVTAGSVAEVGTQTTSSAIPEMVRNTISGEILDLVENLQISDRDVAVIREQVLQFAQGRGTVGNLFSVLNDLTELVNKTPEAFSSLQRLLAGKEFRELLGNSLKNLWTITPEEVAEPGKVEGLYQRLHKQFRSLASALETVGQTDATAYKAVVNLNQNLDFLNQINQMYAYVQLPLKLQQGEAHGELYVYTNKKKLSSNDGTISALLHLDMEHLGPVDVYVAMQHAKVNTKFYVRDDEMLDFLEAHMDLLTERLQKKGYDCSFSMTSRGDGEAAEGGIETILRQEKGMVLSRYAFDVRT